MQAADEQTSLAAGQSVELVLNHADYRGAVPATVLTATGDLLALQLAGSAATSRALRVGLQVYLVDSLGSWTLARVAQRGPG